MPFPSLGVMQRPVPTQLGGAPAPVAANPILSNPSGMATGGAPTNPWGNINPVGPYSNPGYNWGAMQNYASSYGVNPSQVQWAPGTGYSLGNVGTPAAAPSYLSAPQYATGGGVTPSQMNPTYYATPGTAQSVAGLLGGTVTPYNMSGPGSSIGIPTAQGISVGGQNFDAGVLASLLQRGYSPQSLAQQFNLQTGGAAHPSAGAVASYLGAPSTGAAPVPGGTGWLPGNVGQSDSTALQPRTTTLAGAGAGTTTGQTTSGYTTPSAGGPMGGYGGGVFGAGMPSMYPSTTMPGGGGGSPFTGTWAPQTGAPAAYGGNPYSGANYGGPDQFLSSLATGGMGGLQSIVAGGGNPINQLPAWQAMMAAQAQQNQIGAANIQESMNLSGNLGGSADAMALSNYWTQTGLGQSAQLQNMVAQAGEAAQGRLLSAAGQLGGFGYGAGGQLSGQDFQSQMLQQQQAFQAAQALGGYGYGAAQNLLGNANQAALAMYGGQMGALPQFMNQDTMNQQLALQSALGASTNWGQNLLTGAQLGGQQYGLNQQALTNQYNQWLYQQPQYNPFVQQAYQLGTYYPSPIMPSYAPGWFGSLLGAAGQVGGAAVGLSDVRLKENIVPIGTIKGIPLYTYNFRGDPAPQFGPMAQEVAQVAPQAVIPGDETKPWLIKLNKFMDYILGDTSWAGFQPLSYQA